MTFIEQQQEIANKIWNSGSKLTHNDLDALISQVVQDTLRHILVYEQWVSFSEHRKGMAVPSETVHSFLKDITSTTWNPDIEGMKRVGKEWNELDKEITSTTKEG